MGMPIRGHHERTGVTRQHLSGGSEQMNMPVLGRTPQKSKKDLLAPFWPSSFNIPVLLGERCLGDGLEHRPHIVACHRHSVASATNKTELYTSSWIESAEKLFVAIVVDNNIC